MSDGVYMGTLRGPKGHRRRGLFYRTEVGSEVLEEGFSIPGRLRVGMGTDWGTGRVGIHPRPETG